MKKFHIFFTYFHIALSVFITLNSLLVSGNTIITVCDGHWKDKKVWNTGNIPTLNDTIIIKNIIYYEDNISLIDNYLNIIYPGELCGGWSSLTVNIRSVIKVNGRLCCGMITNYGYINITGKVVCNGFMDYGIADVYGSLSINIGGHCTCSALVINCFPPEADFFIDDTVICSGRCINFSDKSKNAQSWHWTFEGASTPTVSQKNPCNICYKNFGTFNTILVAGNNIGTDTIIKKITVLSNSDISVKIKINICSGDSNYLQGMFRKISGIYHDTFTNSYGCDSIITTELTVNPTDTVILNSSFCKTPDHLKDTSYSYWLKNSFNCDSLIITNIKVYPVYDTIIDVAIYEGNPYFFSSKWLFKEGNYQEHFHTSHYCDSLVTIRLTVNKILVFIPSTFTPNHDMKNDEFKIRGGPFSNFSLTVFNAWGIKVFESYNSENGWDGTFNGKPQPEGNYVWNFRGSLPNGEEENLSGVISLIR